MDNLVKFIAKIADGDGLSEAESSSAVEYLLSGDASEAQIAAFMMGLRVRGERVEEILGAAKTMRNKMKIVEAPENAIDIVGTGGDGLHTLNISTASAIVAASCGAIVAKHGGKAASSKSGSADVLGELGVSLQNDNNAAAKVLKNAGICFMFAPNFHPAMRFVGPTRMELKIRTIFNLLGPICNPAQVKRQLLGVYDKKWLKPYAETLNKLGSDHVMIVHGKDGMDELTICDDSIICELKGGEISEYELSPSDVGLKTYSSDEIIGGTPAENAEAISRLVDGEKNAYRDAVALNSGASLVVAGIVDNIKDGVELALSAIDEGKANAKLAKLVEFSNMEH